MPFACWPVCSPATLYIIRCCENYLPHTVNSLLVESKVGLQTGRSGCLAWSVDLARQRAVVDPCRRRQLSSNGGRQHWYVVTCRRVPSYMQGNAPTHSHAKAEPSVAVGLPADDGAVTHAEVIMSAVRTHHRGAKARGGKRGNAQIVPLQ